MTFKVSHITENPGQANDRGNSAALPLMGADSLPTDQNTTNDESTPISYQALCASERYRQLCALPGVGDITALKTLMAENRPGTEENWLSDYQRAVFSVAHDQAGIAILTSLRVAENCEKPEILRMSWDGDTARALFNPWELSRQVPLFTIAHANQCAEVMGIPLNSPDALTQTYLASLDNAMQRHGNGSTYIPLKSVEDWFKGELNSQRDGENLSEWNKKRADWTRKTRNDLIGDNEIIVDPKNRYISPRPLYLAERAIADFILNADPMPFKVPDIPAGNQLDSDQTTAFSAAFTESISVITAGPGFGKTHVVGAIVQASLKAGIPVGVVCLSNRAANQVKKVLQARQIDTNMLEVGPGTIHSSLKIPAYPGQRYREDVSIPERGILIIDEASMVPALLFSKVIRKLKSGWHVVLSGDVDQLSSIDPGDVLRNVCDSKLITVTRLQHCYRAESQEIMDAASAINSGVMPASGETFTIKRTDRPEAVASILGQYLKPLMDRFGVENTLVITEHRDRRKAVNTSALNLAVKRLRFPDIPEREIWKIDVGDRVIASGTAAEQNGRADKNEFGTVIDRYKEGITVAWDNHEDYAEYTWDELRVDEKEGKSKLVNLGYAITVHKAQGSEADFVFFITCGSSTPFLLIRRLAYTACSRAKKLCTVIDVHTLQRNGDMKGGFGRAISTVGTVRKTLLEGMLKEDESFDWL